MCLAWFVICAGIGLCASVRVCVCVSCVCEQMYDVVSFWWVLFSKEGWSDCV